jgi:hypothetical protein
MRSIIDETQQMQICAFIRPGGVPWVAERGQRG